MGTNRTPITEAIWKVAEEMYLESATGPQRAEYAAMSTEQRWGVLEPFLRVRSRTESPEPWMRLIIERMSAKAGT